jgi:hypothetical protein
MSNSQTKAASQTAAATQTEFAATTTSTLAVAANSIRNALIIDNRAAVAIYVKFGSAHSATEGISIAANTYREFTKVPTDAIYIKTASSTGNVGIFTGNC